MARINFDNTSSEWSQGARLPVVPCGPVSFIGLAVPHFARLALRTNNHIYLLPSTLLLGGAVALLCNLVCQLPGDSGLIPLGAITPLIGAPVILYVVLRDKGTR